MKLKLQHLWDSLRSTYWFIPSIMAVLAGVGAVLLVQADRYLSARFIDRLGWIYSGGPEGARAVLSVVAGSVMGTAGVTFSITIAALSLASTQLGPRLLYNFMRDRGNQFVLGTFIATFVFCLLVLRTIRGQGEGEGGPFVPTLSVTAGVGLGLASLGVLIYFIHHVAVSIQAPNVVAAVGRDLAREVEREFTHPLGAPLDRPAPELPPGFAEKAVPVRGGEDGYIQALDEDALVKLAERGDLLIMMEKRAGSFVAEESVLARVWPPERVDAELRRSIQSRFVIGGQRTSEQDLEFAADQLVEMAVRALSPAINDPFTAMGCLDWLGAALCRAAQGRTPDPVRTGADGKVRVIYCAPIRFAGLVDTAFNQIRQFGARSPAVMLRMLEVITMVIRSTRGDPDEVASLVGHAQAVHRAALEHAPDPRDLADIEERYQRVLRAARALVPTLPDP